MLIIPNPSALKVGELKFALYYSVEKNAKLCFGGVKG